MMAAILAFIKGLFSKAESDISAISEQLETKTDTITIYDERVEFIEDVYIWKSGNVATLSGYIKYKMTPTSSQTSILTVPTGYYPKYPVYTACIRNSDGKTFPLQVATSGNVNIFNGGNIATNDLVRIGITYVIA